MIPYYFLRERKQNFDKLCMQLVADMRRLGATVVAADTSSIILATGKHTLSAAVG